MKPVYRTISRRAERQGGKPYDVLVCGHAVPLDSKTRANRYRKARACPACAKRVAELAAEYRRQSLGTAA